jgi:hypothetical protein
VFGRALRFERLSPPFISTTAEFRRNPANFARFIGDFRNAALNASRSIATMSLASVSAFLPAMNSRGANGDTSAAATRTSRSTDTHSARYIGIAVLSRRWRRARTRSEDCAVGIRAGICRSMRSTLEPARSMCASRQVQRIRCVCAAEDPAPAHAAGFMTNSGGSGCGETSRDQVQRAWAVNGESSVVKYKPRLRFACLAPNASHVVSLLTPWSRR